MFAFSEIRLAVSFRLLHARFKLWTALDAVMSPNPFSAISGRIARESCPFATFATQRACWSGLTLSLILTLSCLLGCQSLHKRMVQKSAQCGALCAQASEARENGDADRANRYINEALQKKPSDIETRRQLAETMWKSDRQEEAIVVYSSLLELRPMDAIVAERLAVMQWEANQHSAAANTAMTVLQLEPQSKEAWLIKARHATSEGKLDDALVAYLRLSQLAADDLTILRELGELHLKRGHPDRACPLLRTAMQHPQATPEQRAEIEWLLGVAYGQSERWSVAAAVLEGAISRRDASAEDWCLLGWSRMKNGDVSGAKSDLQRALRIEPESSAARKLARQLDTVSEFTPIDPKVTPASHQESR